MPQEHRFHFPLANGLHARPASCLVEMATGRFGSEIALVNERNGRTANAKSVLSLVGADVRRDDPCRLVMRGHDEDVALNALENFVRDVLPHCDDALPPVPAQPNGEALPRSLKAAGLRDYLRGTCASPGVGWGKVAIAGRVSLPGELASPSAADPPRERERFASAVAALRARTDAKIAAATHAREAAVLKAHRAIVGDVALADHVDRAIQQQGATAAQAVVAAADYFSEMLRTAQSAYVRERVLDVQDVCCQLLELICGREMRAPARLVEPSVCVADHLTPGEFLALDRRHLKGLVLRNGGTTSHTIILARSMGVPALVGVHEALAVLRPGQEVVVDANFGILVANLTEPVRRYYQLETHRLERMHQELAGARRRRAVTHDGHELHVGANVASAEEVQPAIDNGADGIGLFRTEMLFMDRPAPPSEDEQLEIYARAARAAGERALTIRLLDIGGDKPVPYLNLPHDANPFLGYRGVRIYREHADLVRTQLRAILRAAGSGKLRILIPMVCAVEEVRQVKLLLAQAREELEAKGTTLARTPPLGVMLEVPSSAFIIPELCREADFFSIGSNDLAQYFLAADRDNRAVASCYTWMHPAFLRLLKKIADDAHAGRRRVGICGEMSESAAALPLLMALGLDEISMSSPQIPAVKRNIDGAHFDHCVRLLERALQCATADDVEAVLRRAAAERNGSPLLSRDLLVRSRAVNKAEVIKEMTDSLWLAGRVEKPQFLEEEIWLREDRYSTGFGYGFAVPHCKSEHLGANSIAVAKLATPVEWGAADGKPVDVVILLAIRAADHGKEHMRIFSRLSRLVMSEEFRLRVRDETDPEQLLAFLNESLGVRAAVA
jgi:fructose-specific PTS system IIA-like component